MGRLKRVDAQDATKHRTARVAVKLTPHEREALEHGADEAGARLSDYVRELCLRRGAATPIVAGTRRNPEAKALMHELRAIGNNLNQLTRHVNTTDEPPEARELRQTLNLLKAAMARVIAL